MNITIVCNLMLNREMIFCFLFSAHFYCLLAFLNLTCFLNSQQWYRIKPCLFRIFSRSISKIKTPDRYKKIYYFHGSETVEPSCISTFSQFKLLLHLKDVRKSQKLDMFIAHVIINAFCKS